MSTSKDGNDPKGKSVETIITNTSPCVLIVDNNQFDCAVAANLLRHHNVQGIYGCYYGLLVLLCKIDFGEVSLSNLVYILLCKKLIQWFLYSSVAFPFFGFIRYNLK